MSPEAGLAEGAQHMDPPLKPHRMCNCVCAGRQQRVVQAVAPPLQQPSSSSNTAAGPQQHHSSSPPTCSTALATALMMVSRPTAASATVVMAGGMLISRRRGSTMRPGRSSVSSLRRKFCRRGAGQEGGAYVRDLLCFYNVLQVAPYMSSLRRK